MSAQVHGTERRKSKRIAEKQKARPEQPFYMGISEDAIWQTAIEKRNNFANFVNTVKFKEKDKETSVTLEQLTLQLIRDITFTNATNAERAANAKRAAVINAANAKRAAANAKIAAAINAANIVGKMQGLTLDSKPIYNVISDNPWWIGGSRSWDKFYNDGVIPDMENPNLYSDTVKTFFEHNMVKSSLKPGNFDVFFACTNKEECQRIIEHAHAKVKSYVQECNTLLNPKHQELASAKLDQVNCGFTVKEKKLIFGNPRRFELFPAYAISVSFKSDSKISILPQNKTDKVIEYDLSDKLMLYLEVFCVPGLNVNGFKDEYIEPHKKSGLNYLSDIGLITFSELIDGSRAVEKGFDVDKVRYKVITEYYKPIIGLRSLYEAIVDVYFDVFGKSSEFDQLFMDEMILNALRKASPAHDIYVEKYTAKIMEHLRPYINAFIIDLNKALTDVGQKASTGVNDAFMMIIGGDAMRRYKYDIAKTNDIDVKIFVPPNTSSENKASNLVKNKMAEFVSFLIANRKQLLSPMNQEIEVHDSSIYYKAGVVAYNDDINSPNTSFRMRMIEPSDLFPVTLYSIDFRCKVVIDGKMSDGELQKIELRNDIPILDVVIQRNTEPNSYKKETAVKMFGTNNNIPIASIDFLLSDLNKTYLDLGMTRMRNAAGKREQNVTRAVVLNHLAIAREGKPGTSSAPNIPTDSNKKKSFYHLMNYIANLRQRGMQDSQGLQYSQGLQDLIADSQKQNLNRFSDLYSSEKYKVSADASAYVKVFDKIKSENKHTTKHKVPFDMKHIKDIATSIDGNMELEFNPVEFNPVEFRQTTKRPRNGQTNAQTSAQPQRVKKAKEISPH